MSEETTPTEIEETIEETEVVEVETVTIPKDLLTKLRQSERENKRLARDAKRAADLEARLKEIEDADKSEHEKAKERLTELEGSLTSTTSELREARLALAAHSLAGDLGLADVEVALALLPRGDVEYDDTGTPTNLQQLLEGLVERKPILKGSPTPPRKPSLDGGGGGPKSTPPGLTAQELEWAKKLGYDDPAEYVRDRDNGTMDAWVGAKPAN